MPENDSLYLASQDYVVRLDVGHRTGQESIDTRIAPVWAPTKKNPNVYEFHKFSATIPSPRKEGWVQVYCPVCGEQFKVKVRPWNSDGGPGCGITGVSLLTGVILAWAVMGAGGLQIATPILVLAFVILLSTFTLGIILWISNSRKYANARALPINAFKNRMLEIEGCVGLSTSDASHCVTEEIDVDKNRLKGY